MIFSKRAAPEDFDAYYYLRCDEENIKWTGYKTAPDKVKIRDWYTDNINKKDRYFFLFYEDQAYENVVGYLYMDQIGANNNIVDIGYGVHNSCTGRGYGTQIIQYALNYVKENLPSTKLFQARIAKDNIGSVKAVIKNGLTKTNITEDVDFPNGMKKVFETYSIEI